MQAASAAARAGPADPTEHPASSSERHMPRHPGWAGPTYYGRSQLKASPFNAWAVGGYIFLAGLSGGSMMLSALADALRREQARATVRNGRYLAMLAPVIGSPLLIWDLHTPQRFPNMLRIAKRTSPMSIGTWILMSFTGFAGVSAAGELLSGPLPWARRAARLSQLPAALLGSGLGTYTATLLSATSTPFWAAAPRLLAARFASSTIAASAAALAVLEPEPGLRHRLEAIAAMALAGELAASQLSHRTCRKAGVDQARDSRWGRLEKIGVDGLGVTLPLGLGLAGLFTDRHTRRRLGAVASLATLAGSLLLRVSTIGIGDESARRPEISFRFSQPENLPDPRERRSIRNKIEALSRARNRR